MFDNHMNILFIVKMEILVLVEGPYKSCPIMLTMDPLLLSVERLSISEHANESLKNTHVFLASILGATPNHMPLKYRSPIKKSNPIGHVLLIVTSTTTNLNMH